MKQVWKQVCVLNIESIKMLVVNGSSSHLELLKYDKESNSLYEMSKVTSLINLVSDDEEELVESKCLHPSENMNTPFSLRVQSILQEAPDVQGELIRKIIFYYNSTGLQTYKSYLLDLIMCSDIPFYLRIECLNEMESDEDVLIMLLRSSEEDIPVSMITMYANRLLTGNYKTEVVEILKRRVLGNAAVRDLYKVNTIYSTREHKTTMGRLSLYYIELPEASLYSKLQVCGNTMSVTVNGMLEQFVLGIMKDASQEDNARGHAMDILLRFGTPQMKDTARKLVAELGNEYISADAQSVHRLSISKSVATLYKELTSRIVDVSKIPTFKEARETLLSEEKENTMELEDALDYVEGDHIVFGGIERTLKSCLCLVMGFVASYGGDRKEMLYGRIIEELVESLGTCSSGYLSRIANSLSGVDGYIVGISWCEQIRDNFAGRLNARMRDDPKAGEILVQMTNKELSDRTEFFRFLRESIPVIKEEMYQEFRNYMSDGDWDQFIYKAITSYYGK